MRGKFSLGLVFGMALFLSACAGGPPVDPREPLVTLCNIATQTKIFATKMIQQGHFDNKDLPKIEAANLSIASICTNTDLVAEKDINKVLIDVAGELQVLDLALESLKKED